MAIDWLSLAETMQNDMVARRRDFHQHPELSFQEVRTAGIVAQELRQLGLEVSMGVGKTGVVGVLEGQQEGPTVMVRCDMDALPIVEDNETDYISETSGKMHACGHDGHTTIGLAVAKMMVSHRDQIAGRIKFVFQPAEEIGLGAQAMVDDGVLANPTPDVCVGLHLWNDLPLGEVVLTPGPVMASADTFTITVRGAGGHGATPEQTHDPIITGVQIVAALQTISSRNISALDSAVLSVTMFHGGEKENIIPSQAVITGTFRTFLRETHNLIVRRIQEIATGVAVAMGCKAEVKIDDLTHPVVNDPEVTARLIKAIGHVRAEHPMLHLREGLRWMAAEDVSVFLNQIPGTYLLVGSANRERHLDYPHHHPRFDFDEKVLPVGAGLLATAVAEYVMHE